MPSSWIPPSAIAEFRLERRLGRGATSNVWLARDTLLDRVVALKIANVAASPETRTRFRVEARAVAKLQHPNLLGIHYTGEVNERPFLVTEFLSGQSLDDLEQPVAVPRAVAIGIDLARGLAAAHHAGVLHRDIKPANAFLCADGAAKLLDFGLATFGDAPLPRRKDGAPTLGAHASDGALDATQPASWDTEPTIVGTPLYMAPETWRGEPATRHTDVYALGALLFELLGAQAPSLAGLPVGMEVSLKELGARVVLGQLGDLKELAPATPPPLVELVTRCLSLDPEARPSADELCDALVRIAAQSASRTEAPDDPRTNPYRGLLAFGAEQRALFFGRETETAAVIAELQTSPFVLVVGPSGTGKSSLVRAGVVPRIDKGALGAGARGRSAIVVPGRRPIEALARALAPILRKTAEDVRAEIAASTAWLADELRAARAQALLVIDQLEELWTLASGRERDAFFEIVAAITRTAPTVRVVATLRADFLDRLETMGALQALALRALVVLRPMAPDGLRRAIVEPAERRGVTIEPPLVTHLMAHTEEGSLPLLAFALGELYARRNPDSSTIGLADLDALGGVQGALATHADATLARLPESQRREARAILLALVTRERTRSRREERDVLGPGEPDARAVLAALVEARLVVASAGEHGAAYEVAHEALLSGWPTLRAWLEEEAAAREASARIAAAAREWARLGRGAEGLGGAWLLADVATLGSLDGLGTEARSFIAASRAAVRRARVRRQALRFGAPVGAFVLLAAVAAGIQVSERRHARAFVAARLAEAAPPFHDISVLDAQIEAARADAFARYDAGDATGGEARWAEALEIARREADTFVAASAPLGLALARDPLDARARASAADLAYLWLCASERDHETDVARDLVARLARLDDDGSRRARLAAPAHLRVTTVPEGASVVLHTVRAAADGQRIEDDGRPVKLGAPLELAPGSYVLTASAPGRYATRLPVLLGRAQEAAVEIPLPTVADVPQGFVFVPAGVSRLGSADVESVRRATTTVPEHEVRLGAFLIGSHEVTYAEYLEFLSSLPTAERATRRPSAKTLVITYDNEGIPSLTLGATTARQGEPFCRPKRATRRCQDWLRFPVAGIDRGDALAYLAWLASGRVRGARFCTEREWERAARGADGRLYPNGDTMRAGDANFDATYANDDDQMGPDEVGAFPLDRSPFGVSDLAGNVVEWVGSGALTRATRGGAATLGSNAFLYVRAGARNANVGLRVCASIAAPP